ncbi:MAG: hypothetical protein AAGG75_03705 [Bacteroidota bacterium]
MKLYKSNFSLEVFEEIETFEAEELKLINGGNNLPDGMCSHANDIDSGIHTSFTNDIDVEDKDSEISDVMV